jgi:hypothetical protein
MYILSYVQQGYNTPLTGGGPHILWGPPHVREVLYTCCTCGVRESPLYFLSQNGQEVTVTGMVSKVNNNAVSQLEGLDNGHNNSVL